MALKLAMADGTEKPCHTCGQSFSAGDFKVQRPRHNSKQTQWVHERCSPTTSKHHTGSGPRRKKRHR